MNKLTRTILFLTLYLLAANCVTNSESAPKTTQVARGSSDTLVRPLMLIRNPSGRMSNEFGRCDRFDPLGHNESKSPTLELGLTLKSSSQPAEFYSYFEECKD